MASVSVEQKVENLEKVIERLENANEYLHRELERLQAVSEIRNLMSRLEYMAMTNRNDEVPSLFAQKMAGVRLTIDDIGTWDGPDAVRRSSLLFPTGDIPGFLNLHAVTNDCIEISGDGKTAKAVWLGTGFVARVNAKGEPRCRVEYDKYGIDFVKEDGRWKFWHFHIYGLIRADWDEPWAKQFEKPRPMPAPLLSENIRPDKPPGDVYFYHPTIGPKNMPAPPEPYETFDDKTAY